ncbi:hypothetical protein [Streptomyces californicus]|uniref:hypothetical protein n=1 Tax=Streptomyces californicus TaxID=67351 RepID=UPI0037BC4DD8
MRGLRTLVGLGILQRTGDGLTTLHDATRALSVDYTPHHTDTQHQLDLALSGILYDSLTTPGRLARWARLLARIEQTDQLLSLASHDYFFDLTVGVLTAGALGARGGGEVVIAMFGGHLLFLHRRDTAFTRRAPSCTCPQRAIAGW